MYLKSNGIKYKMFNIANNFSETYVHNCINGGGFPDFKPKGSKNNQMYEIIKNKFIPNTWNDKIEYKENPYLNYYWNLIDWDSFWFYGEEGNHKYGGVTEWAIKNFDINDPERDTNYRNALFLEQILHDGVEYTEDNLISIYEDWRSPLGNVSARMYKIFVQKVINSWNLF